MISVIELLTRNVDYVGFEWAYLSEEFNAALVSEGSLVERTLRERTEVGPGKLAMRIHVVPRVQLPAFVQKLMQGHAIAYVEVTDFDRSARSARTRIETPGRGVLSVSAITSFREGAAGVSTRIELDVQAQLFGLGALLERFVARETEAQYRILERVLQRFVDEHSAMLPRAEP